MIFADGALGLIMLGLWIFCIIDVITTDESQMRNLPKLVWLLLVLVLIDLGSLLWLVAGRVWQPAGQARDPNGAFPEYDRPGRAAPANPDDDEQFLRNVRERADAQRRRYEAQRQAEVEAEQARPLKKPDEQ
jgi:Phospholipase_D-nuclease N-terminal